MNQETDVCVRDTSSSAARNPPKTKLAALLMAAGAFLTISMADSTAHADIDGVNCTITNVWYDQFKGGRLILFCNGETNLALGYYAYLSEPACTQDRSFDTLKVWTSMATAYQLAGHKIFIEFNKPNTPGNSCGNRTINNFR